MTITTGIAIYFVMWWVVLFAILPWGIRSQADDRAVVAGSDPGAPTAPSVLRRLAWNTVITAILFAIGAWLYESRTVTLDDLGTLWGWLGPRRS